MLYIAKRSLFRKLRNENELSTVDLQPSMDKKGKQNDEISWLRFYL